MLSCDMLKGLHSPSRTQGEHVKVYPSHQCRPFLVPPFLSRDHSFRGSQTSFLIALVTSALSAKTSHQYTRSGRPIHRQYSPQRSLPDQQQY